MSPGVSTFEGDPKVYWQSSRRGILPRRISEQEFAAEIAVRRVVTVYCGEWL